jgi:uroporphyrinogen-III synthase
LPGNRVLLLLHSGEEEPIPHVVAGWDIHRLAVSHVREVPARQESPFESVILTSRHAARWFVRSFPDFCGTVVASGPTTAAVLEHAGIRCLVPAVPGGANALELLEANRGDRVFFPCAERTAGTVEALAQVRGLRLERLVVYRLDPVAVLDLPWRIDALGFFSGQMVEYFKRSIPDWVWNELSQLPVLCMQGTAQAALGSLGWVGQVYPLEKTPGQSDLSSLLLNMVASPDSQSSRGWEHPGPNVPESHGGADFL